MLVLGFHFILPFMRLLLPLLLSLFFLKSTAQDFYALDEVQEVRLSFVQTDWEQLLDSMKRHTDKERLTADLIIDGVKYMDVGVRYKGNSSYFSTVKSEEQKLPFNIKLDHINKEQATPEGYETLKLSNVFRDPSFVREVLSYKIARDYMAAPKCNFVQLYINDKYWGLYNNSQSVDSKFLISHFGDKEGSFFKCDPPGWGNPIPNSCVESDKASLQYLGKNVDCYRPFYELKSDSVIAWKYLIELTEALNKNSEELPELLNIDETLWMLAFNNVLVNLDSYTGRLCHNYYLYEDSIGQFHPVIWDLNMSFGGFRYIDETEAMSVEDMQTLSPFVYYKKEGGKRPLINHLLADDLQRKIYLAHIRTILDNHFTNGDYLKRAKTIQEQLDELVQNDKNKLYSYEDFKKNLDSTIYVGKYPIVGISELMETRTTYLNNHPLLRATPPTLAEARHEQQNDSLHIQCQSDASQVWLFHRPYRQAVFQKIKMEQTDKAWTVAIPFATKTQYYLVAENKKAAVLLPEKAARVFFEVAEVEVAEVGEAGE